MDDGDALAIGAVVIGAIALVAFKSRQSYDVASKDVMIGAKHKPKFGEGGVKDLIRFSKDPFGTAASSLDAMFADLPRATAEDWFAAREGRKQLAGDFRASHGDIKAILEYEATGKKPDERDHRGGGGGGGKWYNNIPIIGGWF